MVARPAMTPQTTGFKFTARLLPAVFAFFLASEARGHDDKRRPPVTIASVQALIAKEKAGKPAIPLVVNKAVIDRINSYRVRPGQASSLRAALRRSESYRQKVELQLRHAKLPIELFAIPLVESRFQNVTQKAKKASTVNLGAGIWMFIKPTARRYGLHISQKADERLDIERQTNAAVRYLTDLYTEFRDWHLVLAAYNEGEGAVRAAVTKGRTRDAWKLVEQGYLNQYLVYITAGMLIMKYPQLVS